MYFEFLLEPKSNELDLRDPFNRNPIENKTNLKSLEIHQKLQAKTFEIASLYNKESIEAISNLFQIFLVFVV